MHTGPVSPTRNEDKLAIGVYQHAPGFLLKGVTPVPVNFVLYVVKKIKLGTKTVERHGDSRVADDSNTHAHNKIGDA